MIDGYDHGPLVAGEPLVTRRGFWSSHLLGQRLRHADAEPEWFGDDGADVETTYDVLTDPDAWPVLRVPFGAGYEFVVVYRNLVDDPGVDYLVTHPGWPGARAITRYEGTIEGETLTWPELTRVLNLADGPLGRAAHLLLLLPLLSDPGPPAEAVPAVSEALVAVGAPQDTAPTTAHYLVGHEVDAVWHEPARDFFERVGIT